MSTFRDPLQRVLRIGGPAAVALLVLATPAGFAIAGPVGAIGAAAGALLPGMFFLATAASAVLGRDAAPSMFGVYVLFGWLGKMLLLVLALWALTTYVAFHRGIFFTVLLVGTFVQLGIEWWMVTRTAQLYVDPSGVRH